MHGDTYGGVSYGKHGAIDRVMSEGREGVIALKSQ